MTSKTITMARDNIERLIDRLSKAQMFKEVTELRAALADPVPPAGGDVKVLGYSVKGNRYAIRLTKGELLELSENYTGTVLIELVDRAHVTRLQAEVKRLDLEVSAYDYAHDALSRERDALKAELRKTNLTNQDFVSQIGDLQSELTKAREGADKWKLAHRLATEDNFKLTKALELLKEADNFMYIMTGHDSHARLVHQYGKEWWTPVNELRGKICTALSNQSAPADKGEECVHDFRMFSGECHKCGADWIPGKEYAPAEKGEPVAFPGYPPVPEDRKLPADQPAPVAVSLPERKTVKAGLLSESNTHNQGWNACLDELARLNPIKQ